MSHNKTNEKNESHYIGAVLALASVLWPSGLQSLPVDEAGEIIQTVLAYGMDGTKPEFKDKYQQRYYESFLDPITEQIAYADNVR